MQPFRTVAFTLRIYVKFQNHLNLSIAIKALLFIFKNKGMGLDFLYTFFTCFIFISSSSNFFYNIMLIMFLPPSSVAVFVFQAKLSAAYSPYGGGVPFRWR